MTKRVAHWLLVGALMAMLAGCDLHVTPVATNFPFSAATPIDRSMTEAIAAHTLFSTGVRPLELANGNLHTLTAVDLYGEPFTNITFVLPSDAGDPWSYAATPEGRDAIARPDDNGWRTIFTGASTIRDVLIGYRSDLHLLRDLHATATALGGEDQVTEVVAALPSVFLLRDTTGVLWDVTTQRPLSRADVRTITARYDEIIAANANEAFVATMQGYWAQLEEEAARQQAIHGYALDDLLTPTGTLDLARIADIATTVDSAEVQPSAFTDHLRQCFLFVCWHRFTGHIATAANQATQGGFRQERAAYGLATPPSRFNSIVRATNGPVTGTAYLGCGPSAFIGLVGERFKNHGTTFSGMNRNDTTLLAFRQWMVAPVGVNGRPRIANNMGTCAIGSNHEGLTTLAGLTSGAQTLLNYTNSGLTLRYNAGMGGSTGWNSGTAATMIHQQVGVRENPVVATYWPGIAAAHHAAIQEYDIMWGAGVTINIKTIDHPTTWHGLAGNWHYQAGVFYLE